MSEKQKSNFMKRLIDWLRGAGQRSQQSMQTQKLREVTANFRKKIPGKLKDFDFDFRKVDLKNVSQYSTGIQWGLVILALFLLASLTSSLIGLWLKPSYAPLAARPSVQRNTNQPPVEDYDAILRRNMFNVEGKIPDPFDQGQLDCMSQAKLSATRISLLGTIVMNDERHSVALLQDEGSIRLAVKKDDVFGDGKFQALKVERKKLCFQVKATQDYEFIEIPEENLGTATPSMVSATDGITPVSEGQFTIKNDFLQKNLLNLSEVLQTARAVPYVDPSTGKFRGFLVQTIDQGSLFSQLGIRQGDVLTGVNDIVLDNAGKGLEAFQRLRASQKISLKFIRGGSEQTLNYDVK